MVQSERNKSKLPEKVKGIKPIMERRAIGALFLCPKRGELPGTIPNYQTAVQFHH